MNGRLTTAYILTRFRSNSRSVESVCFVTYSENRKYVSKLIGSFKNEHRLGNDLTFPLRLVVLKHTINAFYKLSTRR